MLLNPHDISSQHVLLGIGVMAGFVYTLYRAMKFIISL